MIEATQKVLRRKFKFTEGPIPHSPDDMVFEMGNASDALLYSLLFVPQLSLIDDSVILTNGDDDIANRFLEGKRNTHMSLQRLEASFNMKEVPFLFANGKLDGDEEDEVLAEALATAWRRALTAFSPDREFAVNIIPAEKNAGNTTVEFYEVRS